MPWSTADKDFRAALKLFYALTSGDTTQGHMHNTAGVKDSKCVSSAWDPDGQLKTFHKLHIMMATPAFASNPQSPSHKV